MSDLIRKSDVLDLLYGIFDKYKMSTDKNTSIGKSFGTDVFEEIRNMPTAYDIDKVVEELEELKVIKDGSIPIIHGKAELELHDKAIRNKDIDDFLTDIINKINFEDKWLFNCKSNNADTDIAFSALRTFINERAEQLKAGESE